MRKTHDYEHHYENEGVAGSCRIGVYQDGDRPIVVATQQREPQGAHLGSVLNAANIIAADLIRDGTLTQFHLSREIREESVRRQTLELIADVAPFVFVEEYLDPEHKLSFLWFDSYEVIGLILDGKPQKQIGNPYRQPASQEEVQALIGEYSFVCQCDERFRSACEGLPFYAEHEGRPYCVLHYPGFNEKVYAFDDVINKKLEEGDLNFRGAWFPYPRSFQVDHDFESTADFSYATFNRSPGEEYQTAAYFMGSRFLSDVSFHETKFLTGAFFSGASFEGAVDFSEAIFDGPAVFTEKVSFRGGVDFSGVGFAAEADFSEARFERGIELLDTEFQGDVSFYNSMIRAGEDNPSLDFSQVVFHQRAYFGDACFYADEVRFAGGGRDGSEAAKFGAEAIFYGAAFGGKVSAGTSYRGDTYFYGLEFPQETDFSRTTFCGTASFGNATFCQNVGFYDARFCGPTFFNEARFLEEANFIDAKSVAGGNASFMQAEFGGFATFDGATLSNASFRLAVFKKVRFPQVAFGSADFVETTFADSVDFQGSTWKRADFSEAKFYGDTSFVDTSFESEAKFSEAIFTDRARFFGTENNKMFKLETAVDFQDVRIHEPEQLTFHTLLLRPSWFVNADVRNCGFVNVQWHGLPGGPKDTLDKEIERLQKRRVSSPHSLLAKTCRDLYANYEEKRDYQTAGEFHYWAMDALRKEGLRRFGFIRFMYWAMSGYGERPGQAFWVLVAIWLAFALSYFLLADSSPFWVFSASDTWQGIDYARQAAVYSLSALARLNPRPLPEGLDWFQFLVTVEGILGPLQIALFALAVRRKVMR